MAKSYITRCIIKRNGEYHKKGSVINDLTEEEIKQGLERHWLQEVGHDDEPKPDTPPVPKPEKDLNQMNKQELLAKAKSLGLQLDESMEKAEIRLKIAEAQV